MYNILGKYRELDVEFEERILDSLKRKSRLGFDDPRLLQNLNELELNSRYKGEGYENPVSRYLGQRYQSTTRRKLYLSPAERN